ncbi:MAG: hypothetical protein KatS3mg052_2926 [Candidatus Roseilinea sp.]|nr:MAG: hypothetical protein KatS3mg052_2926 [Candidatus Roseilinea sp.]
MDSLSRSSVTAASAEGERTQLAGSLAGSLTVLEWGIRAALCASLIGVLIRQLNALSLDQALYPLMLYGSPAAAYLLASVPTVAAAIRRQAESQPLGMALLALAPFAPVMLYARVALNVELTGLLLIGALVFLPVACAILNVPRLRRADISLGLVTVALPLLLPYAPDSGIGATPEPLTTFDIAARIGAFLLPLALLLFTTRKQKQQLNFLFVCSVLSLWYAWQFGAFPAFPIAHDVGATYFQLAVIPLFLYVLAVAGRFDRLGMLFKPSPRSVSVAAANLALLAALGVPTGLATGALVPAFQGPPPLEAATQALNIFLLVALPQEILFRGTLLTYLQDALRLDAGVAAVISSVLFGVTHAHNSASVGWTFILATFAGIFCARVFLATRNIVAAGVVHAFARWARWLLFSG